MSRVNYLLPAIAQLEPGIVYELAGTVGQITDDEFRRGIGRAAETLPGLDALPPGGGCYR
jgi:hypothetical protein